MTDFLNIRLAVSAQGKADIQDQPVLFLPLPGSSHETWNNAFLALNSFIEFVRMDLATHKERLDTVGVGDPDVAASLELQLQGAINAQKACKAVLDIGKGGVVIPGSHIEWSTS